MRSGALDRIRAALADAGELLAVQGTLPADIADLTDDSRRLRAGALFCAVRGTQHDGHRHLGAAAAAGAALAMVEDATDCPLPALVVRDGRRAAALAAAAAYEHPARALTLVGVTGTNGKTTSVGLLRHLLDAPGAPAASIGTLGVLVGSAGTVLPGGAGLTTPGPIELQRLLRALVDAGVRRVAMETSSHALDQGRVAGVRFAAGLFTNLTRDHLDYHGTMEAYFAAKARLVAHLASDGVAVSNADDPAWDALPPAPRRLRFGLRAADAEVRAVAVRHGGAGSQWTLHTPAGDAPVALPLLGDFNVENALGAAAVAVALGEAPADVAARLATVPQVAGRLERLSARPLVIRDYAHTPDALARALAAVRPCVPGGRLIVVFGCGGDRDPGKRPEMGAIAAAGADHVVLTSDNPRTEDPERILDAIQAGIPGGAADRIEDRRAAIAHALALADPDRDLVLLAGKGHETYQIRGTTTYPFDEAVIVADLLRSAP
jgi:UDP-N-acetylmuramoyl-L-alanyl-D-glutamate--2,6-diaminopimelate ligase